MDENGRLAESGKLNNELLQKLGEISFYNKKFPKSLGIEEYHQWYKPILDNFNIKVHDKLHTTGYHLCSNIKKIIEKHKNCSELCMDAFLLVIFLLLLGLLLALLNSRGAI